MVSFDWLRKEVEGYEWIKNWIKKRKFRALRVGLVLVCAAGSLFLCKDYSQYVQVKEVAIKIYPEILANVKEIEKHLTPSYVTSALDNPKGSFKNQKNAFSFEIYDKYYSSFRKAEVDAQVQNFYINLKRNRLEVFNEDYSGLREQGRFILDKLSFYFGCRDAFAHDDSKRHLNIVSQDVNIPTNNIRFYFRYKFK